MGAGDRLGDYEILAQVDKGGMAKLYLARRTGPAGFERPVAVKVLHASHAQSPEFAQMFVDEANGSASFTAT